jgi:hypothetical protein
MLLNAVKGKDMGLYFIYRKDMGGLHFIGMCSRYEAEIQIITHVAMRPNAGKEKEPIPRRDTLSKDKLEAEGARAESQIVLGWRINTRLLSLQLPLDKFTAWSSDIVNLLERTD